MDKFNKPFLNVSLQTALCVAMSETKEICGAFNVNQANTLLIIYINHIIPSGLSLKFWQEVNIALINAELAQISHSVFFSETLLNGDHLLPKAASPFKHSHPVSMTKTHFSD